MSLGRSFRVRWELDNEPLGKGWVRVLSDVSVDLVAEVDEPVPVCHDGDGTSLVDDRNHLFLRFPIAVYACDDDGRHVMPWADDAESFYELSGLAVEG